MGLLGRLSGLLGGSTGGDATGSSGAGEDAPDDGGDGTPDRDERASALADAGLPAAPLTAVVARVRDEPSAFADHVPDLLHAVREGSAASVEAAAVLGVLAERDPSVAAPHADALVDALACDDEHAREHVADALALVARERSVPADRLLVAVADGDATGRAAAARVLGVVAATRPGAMPVERVEALAEGDDVARAAGRYLLAVLAADRRVVGGDATADEIVALAAATRDADLDAWLTREFTHDAIRAIVASSSPDAGCRDVTVVATPTGTDVHLHVDDPASVDVEAVGDALADRLGLSDVAVLLDET